MSFVMKRIGKESITWNESLLLSFSHLTNCTYTKLGSEKIKHLLALHPILCEFCLISGTTEANKRIMTHNFVVML